MKIRCQKSANLVDDEKVVVEESSNIELEKSAIGFGVEATVINADKVSKNIDRSLACIM